MTEEALSCYYCAEAIATGDDAVDLTPGSLQYTEGLDDDEVPWIEYHAGSDPTFCHRKCLPSPEELAVLKDTHRVVTKGV